MTAFTPIQRATALIAAAFLLAGPALADKPEHAGKGRGNKHEQKAEKHEAKAEKHGNGDRRDDVKVGAFFTDEHRQAARSYYVQQYGGGKKCPPGLAKKNNGCMPPGQAKKWAVGQPLPHDVVVYSVPRPVLVALPVAPYGYRYVRVGNDILLLSPTSALVVDVITGLLG